MCTGTFKNLIIGAIILAIIIGGYLMANATGTGWWVVAGVIGIVMSIVIGSFVRTFIKYSNIVRDSNEV